MLLFAIAQGKVRHMSKRLRLKGLVFESDEIWTQCASIWARVVQLLEALGERPGEPIEIRLASGLVSVVVARQIETLTWPVEGGSGDTINVYIWPPPDVDHPIRAISSLSVFNGVLLVREPGPRYRFPPICDNYPWIDELMRASPATVTVRPTQLGPKHPPESA